MANERASGKKLPLSELEQSKKRDAFWGGILKAIPPLY
jgi:hypothetical protein